ncbi:hypothetical protein N2W54_003588 [Lotmaria passim]
MGRRKSVKPEKTEELRRRPSQYRGKNGGRSRNGSDESDGQGQLMSREPSMRKLHHSLSKSGSSFHRSSRSAEDNQPAAYKGFHFPSGEPQQQLEPLLTSHGGLPSGNATTHNGSNNAPCNSSQPGSHGRAPSFYGGASANICSPVMNGHYDGVSPIHNTNVGTAANAAPLTRRDSQVRMSTDTLTPANLSPSQPPPPPTLPLLSQQQQQQNMRYPMPINGPLNVSATSYQQQPSIDFNRMMQMYRNLPQLPYVMTPQGPLPPPPFPFPYPDPAQLQSMMMNGTTSEKTSPPQRSLPYLAPSPSPPPQQQPSPLHPQQQPYPPSQQLMGAQRPLYNPPANGMANSSDANDNGNVNGSSGTAPVPAAATSPFNGSGGAPSPSATGVLLHKATSILKRVSSFKRSAPAAAPTSPSSVVQAAQTSPTAARASDAAAPVPPQHSAAAAAAKNAVELPPTGILRRKSFFAKAAAATPEQQLTPEERELLLKEKLEARELERQRLEAEHQAREEAAQRLHEQRLQELRKEFQEEAQAAESTAAAASPATTTSTTTAAAEEPAVAPASAMTSAKPNPPPHVSSPVAEAIPITETVSPLPPQSISSAGSYSFASVSTTRNERPGPQPSQQQPQPPSWCQRQRATSQTPDIGYCCKNENSGSSTTSNRHSSPNKTPTTRTAADAGATASLMSTPATAMTSINSSSTLSGEQPRPRQLSNPTAVGANGVSSEPQSPPFTREAPKQLWHRCPSLVLYEIPLRCHRTTNEKGEEVIDDANFPVRISHHTMRVTDAETQLVSEYPHDEFITHRKGSTNVESKLLDKVRDVVVAGYAASVLSLDTKDLAKPTSAFDSAAWMAKQRLVLNVVSSAEKMQTIYVKNGGVSGHNSSIEVCVSIALVKKVSAEKAEEWKLTNEATRQRTFEVVDLLQPEPAVVPFRMQPSVLYGSRLGGVEYKPVANEADLSAAVAGAQSNANVVLGRLADAAAVEPDNADLAKEKASVFEVLTCVVRHRKEGAVALADQLKEAPRDVFARCNADEALSSDDEDDDARIFGGFNSHNGPSKCSDLVVSCLTCIGVRHNAELWGAALEHREEMAPSALFSTAFGGPAYTVILASIDPTKPESAEALSMQAGMTIKLHRRPTNGSARRLIQCSKYQAGAAQKELDRPVRPTGSEQRELKMCIRKSAATLDSLERELAAGD